jgi:hypothetical protein
MRTDFETWSMGMQMDKQVFKCRTFFFAFVLFSVADVMDLQTVTNAGLT